MGLKEAMPREWTPLSVHPLSIPIATGGLIPMRMTLSCYRRVLALAKSCTALMIGCPCSVRDEQPIPCGSRQRHDHCALSREFCRRHFVPVAWAYMYTRVASRKLCIWSRARQQGISRWCLTGMTQRKNSEPHFHVIQGFYTPLTALQNKSSHGRRA